MSRGIQRCPHGHGAAMKESWLPSSGRPCTPRAARCTFPSIYNFCGRATLAPDDVSITAINRLLQTTEHLTRRFIGRPDHETNGLSDPSTNHDGCQPKGFDVPLLFPLSGRTMLTESSEKIGRILYFRALRSLPDRHINSMRGTFSLLGLLIASLKTYPSDEECT